MRIDVRAAVETVALLCRAGTSGVNRFGPDPDDRLGRIDLAEVFR